MPTKHNYSELELPKWLNALGVNWDGDLANIQILRLCSCNITSLPESIGQLSNLQDLDLRKNQLTSLPESIGQLSNLQGLYLSNNKIITLPDSIGRLNSLSVLEIADNHLTNIPNSIGRLAALSRLEFNGNQLTSLPKSIGQLIELRVLQLNDNPLTDLSPLKAFKQEEVYVYFLGVELPRCYWTKLDNWQPEWLLDEDNAEIRRLLIQQLGYDRICDGIGAATPAVKRSIVPSRMR